MVIVRLLGVTSTWLTNTLRWRSGDTIGGRHFKPPSPAGGSRRYVRRSPDPVARNRRFADPLARVWALDCLRAAGAIVRD